MVRHLRKYWSLETKCNCRVSQALFTLKVLAKFYLAEIHLFARLFSRRWMKINLQLK